jgi:acid phosphatase (class A)
MPAESKPMIRRLTLPAALATLAVFSACQTAPPTLPELVGEVRAGSGYLKGYLDRQQLPDSLALLPKPPAEGSAAAAADLAAYRATQALRDTPRWALAAADDNLKFPKAADTFACALGLPISQQATPHLNMVLRRTLADAGLSTYAAKDSYQRQRPFAALQQGSCAPASEAALAKDGSYPSGHAALGWGWALLLADALLQRGHAFGQSRVICGLHWQSDVDSGRLMGAAVIARLHADPSFSAQAAQARAEIEASRAKGATAPLNCAAEAPALKP